MSTNWLHDLLFGSNELKIEALEKAQKLNAKQLEKVFNTFEKIDNEQLQLMQDHLNSLQEKVETLTETVANQEKITLTCCIAASVVALAAISFIGFCIYQGMKNEKEKQRNSFQSVSTKKLTNLCKLNPDTKFNIDISNTKKSIKGQESVAAYK
ncbi:hypothetical protein [Wolbachia endosymbiont of Dirofilaria (Dirofilaria) immitis]|uniref:hypothetical protein n=1 Tax=Wolbachia endosymbiont of Dirofilaria (Dirofilaria) immitis TaxID=1812115 RepID=UPI00158C622F|nr:hypothetical protein [Wolbachia endosymbiont of Dirofilaria (Dirofilaria) immitis]QKX02482.1 hypothetical protein GOY12_02895 [Wolbachia endosymbiont of Dirofilaria (Dirofilaria) immitis]